MKGNVFIITYFYWQDGRRVQYCFEVYNEENYTLKEVESIAKEKILETVNDGYYITKQEILASNI